MSNHHDLVRGNDEDVPDYDDDVLAENKIDRRIIPLARLLYSKGVIIKTAIVASSPVDWVIAEGDVDRWVCLVLFPNDAVRFLYLIGKYIVETEKHYVSGSLESDPHDDRDFTIIGFRLSLVDSLMDEVLRKYKDELETDISTKCIWPDKSKRS